MCEIDHPLELALMRVTGTNAAEQVIERVRAIRSGNLTITIGTGCCESTAPFLYEDYLPGPDQERIGEVAGVPVFAPKNLVSLYEGEDLVTIDAATGLDAESMSVETELSCRLILRTPGSDFAIDQGRDRCQAPSVTPTIATGGPSHVVGELPEPLRQLRLRG